MASQNQRKRGRAPFAAALLAGTSLGSAIGPVQGLTAPALAPSFPMIVKFRHPDPASEGAVPAAEVLALGGRLNLQVQRARPILQGLHAVTFADPNPGESNAQALARLRADPEVEFAEADQRRYVHSLPDDPLFVASAQATGQWYLQSPNADPNAPTPSATDAVDAWSITTGSAGLVIADLDTGIRFDHPDLLRAAAGGRLLPGYDFISSVAVGNAATGPNADASDPGDWVTAADLLTAPFSSDTGCSAGNSTWHGTRVAGVLGALSDNDLGIAGMTWSGWLLPVRVIGKCGGADSDVESGMLWAAGVPVAGYPTNPYPARIINLSLGAAGSCPQSYQSVINQLLTLGVLVVASAGNDGGPVAAPANCTGVAAVAGLRALGTKVGYSNLGPQVALSAPAGNCVTDSGACVYSIDTTVNLGTTTPQQNSYTDAYNTNLGTSFSAPMVSGIAGLMLSVNGNLRPAQLIARLQQGASSPFPVNSAVPQCHVPSSSTDDSQNTECDCTSSTCGAGMANALGAVQEAQRPIAAVKLPVSVAAGKNVVLDASTSAAACQRSIASYTWSVVSGTATLTGAGTALVGLQVPFSGSVTLQVVVTDNLGLSDTAQVRLSASSASSTGPASAGTTPCLTSITPALPITVSVNPSTGPTVQAGVGSQAFTAAVTSAANTAVTWKVNGVAGGNATSGTITAAGLYTAPTSVPTNPVVTVSAVSVANPAAMGFMGLTITAPVAVSVTPAAAALLTNATLPFVASVSNTGNQTVSWLVNGIAGGNASVGTVTSAGVYAAPASVPSPPSVTVTAVSAADPAAAPGVAVVTLSAPAGSASGGGVNNGGGAQGDGGASGSTTPATGGTGGGGALDLWTLLALSACVALRRQAARGIARACSKRASSLLASFQCQSSSSPLRSSINAEQLSTQSPSLQ